MACSNASTPSRLRFTTLIARDCCMAGADSTSARRACRKTDGGEVVRDALAMPPQAGGPMFGRGGEAVSIQARADPLWRTIGKRIDAQQPEDRAIALEQMQDQGGEPRLVLRAAHRREPHQPVEIGRAHV